jgi:hypothetical protein
MSGILPAVRVPDLGLATTLTGAEQVLLVQGSGAAAVARRAPIGDLVDAAAGPIVAAQLASQVAPTLLLTRDPLPTDDSAAGIQVFSPALNTNTGRWFVCLGAAVGAAVWRMVPFDLGATHISGLTYPIDDIVHVTNIAVTAPDVLFLNVFELHERVLLSALVQRIFTGGTGSAVKQAIWADAGGRPIGAPLVQDAVGVATTASNAQAVGPVAGGIGPGRLWYGAKHTGSVLPFALSIGSTYHGQARRIGRAGILANNTMTALSIASAYAAAMPTFAGGEAFGEHVTGGVAVPHFTVA